jgi:hypothetical protein
VKFVFFLFLELKDPATSRRLCNRKGIRRIDGVSDSIRRLHNLFAKALGLFLDSLYRFVVRTIASVVLGFVFTKLTTPRRWFGLLCHVRVHLVYILETFWRLT